MKALTVCQPWAHAICYRGKNVENRSWRPEFFRGTLAIHAGRSRRWFTGEALPDGCPEPSPSSCVFGAIVAHCELARCVRPEELPGNPWAEGPWCWVLEDMRVLRSPVFCRGARGLWELPHELELAVAYGDSAGAPKPENPTRPRQTRLPRFGRGMG